MKKYRVRLRTGRVVGPFVKEQVGELYQKGHLLGGEECQLFPDGDWTPLIDFPELLEYTRIISPAEVLSKDSIVDSTIVKKISDLESLKDQIKKKKEEIPVEELSTDSLTPHVDFPQAFKVDIEKIERQKREQIEQEKEKKLQEDEIKKFNLSNLSNEVEKTVINVNTEKYLEQLAREKKEAERVARKKEVQQKEDAKNVVKADDATQMVSLAEVRDLVKTDLPQAEMQLQKADAEAEEAAAEKQKKEISPPAVDKEKTIKNKKKKMSLAVALAFLAVFWVLLGEDTEIKKIEPQPPQMIFPQEFSTVNVEQSRVFYKQGIETYKKGTYLSKMTAAKMFEKSLANKFENNNALGMLILTYAEMLRDSTNEEKDGNTLFRLIRAGENKSLRDINIAIGRSLFFMELKRPEAAMNVLQDFLRINKKPSLLFMAAYLRSLVGVGNFSEARKIVNTLTPVKNKPVELYVALAEFFKINQDIAQSLEILRNGLTQYPSSVELMVMKVAIHIDQQEFQLVNALLERIQDLSYEGSVYYYAKYLEYKGVLFAYQGKIEEATKSFKLALGIQESPELISKLSSLELSGEGDGKSSVVKLIQQSKSIDYMNKSRFALKEANWELAMSNAVEAVDSAPNYIPSRLYLAELQISRGFFEQAINGLLELHKKNSKSPKINLALVRAYLAAYKFKDAQKHLNIVSSSSRIFRESSAYAKGLADMFIKQKLYIRAMKWLKESIARDPIDDTYYFKFAELLIHLNKFKEAQNLLNTAISLNPGNMDYNIAYSQILYEQGTEIAIGYLRQLLERYPDNPKILGEIAINYYKSGQVKYFEDTLVKLNKLPQRSVEVYDYLRKASLLEEKFDDVIKYSEELLKLDPGKLDVRMQLGEILLESKRYKEALKNFNLVKERLPSYPKMLFFVSQIWLAEGNTEKAMEMAEKEIKMNPEIEDGYVLIGNIKSNLGEYGDALIHYQKAQQINPNSADALIGLASIKFKQNHSEAALDLYTKALELDPSNAFLHKQIGMVYKTLGQGALAVESFQTYLNLNPMAKDKNEVQQLIDDLK